jgi:dienelactone hydrolase
MLAILFCLWVQAPTTVLAPEDQPKKMLHSYLLSECGKEFDARRKIIALLKTPEDVRKRQEELRAKLIEAIGGFPEKTPLNARVTGKESRDGYRIEKLIYESRPDHHVTATLYLPAGPGPFPAVLFPCGHWDHAKAAEDYQRSCILMALHGIGALCFDPISQGERVQLLTPEGKPAVGYGTLEHTMADVGALLVGRCTASYEIWDGIRGLDYLASRPEIDPKRLGCMGNSGGGTQTGYLMALDERILCAVPNCFITSRERLFATIGPQDGEQNIPGQVALGIEHADYLLLRAPRPTQISCTTRDFFDIQGAWITFREAKGIYGILGHSECADLFEYNEPHSLSRPIREAAVGWFLRWLTGVDEIPVETNVPVATIPELRCTTTGNVVSELKGKTIFDLTAERERELAAGRGTFPKDALLKEVRRLIGLRGEIPAAVVRLIEEPRCLFETEPGIKIPGYSSVAKGAKNARLMLVVNGEGNAKTAAREDAFLSIDLRGMGETLPEGKRVGWERYFNFDWRESFLGMDLYRPLLGQRTFDLLSVVGALATVNGVHAVGVGSGAPIVLHAAALDPRIAEVTLEGGVISWSAVARTPITINQLTNVVPRALKVYDLPDLAALLAPRPLTITNAVDPAGRPVSQAVLDETYASARAAYQAAGAADRLVLKAAP